MTNKKWIVAMLGAAAMAVSAGAMAQQADTGLYLGASIGQADLEIDKDTAWKIFGGYQLNRTFAVELGYTNLGEASETVLGVPATAEATAWEVIGVAKFPVANQFSVYGLAGIAMVEAEGRAGGITVSDDSTELTFGVGAQYDVSRNLGVRAQWQRYGADEDIDVISLGVVWKF
ncbi:MAG: porin family protein [Burkholderiales bacterium]